MAIRGISADLAKSSAIWKMSVHEGILRNGMRISEMLGCRPISIAMTGAGLLAASLPFTVLAANPPSAFEDCMGRAENNAKYSECSRTEISRQEKFLTGAWHDASEKMKSTDMRSFQSLLEEQRKWIQWKDSACRYYLDGFGREGVVLHYPLCFIKILADRVAYLKALADELGAQ